MHAVRRLVQRAANRLTGSSHQRVLTLLALVLVLDYADRTLVGALGPTLKHVFSLNNFQLGLLAAAFSFVGAGASIPLGILTDRVSRTMLLALTLVMWCIALIFVGAAVSFAMLFGARIFLGAVAAATGPTTPSLVGDLVPASQRGKALGFITSGQLIGGGIGFMLPVAITAILSWRWTFWLLAIGGVALAIAFWRIGEPARRGAAGPAEAEQSAVANAQGDTGNTGQRLNLEEQIVEERQIAPREEAVLKRAPAEMSMADAAVYAMRVRTDLIVLVARSIGDFFFQGLSTFAVVFATGWYGISQSGADLAILVVGVGAIIGTLVVGRAGDALVRRGMLNSRVWISGLGYILAMVAAYPAFLTHSLPIALAFFALAAFFLAGTAPPLDAIRIDVLAPELRGRTESIRQVLRTAAEGGAPVAIGALAGALASGSAKGLQLAFLVTLPALALNGLILLIALRTYEPDIAAAVASDELTSARSDSSEA